MKLIIQIPALNEEETIGQVIRALPRRVAGISSVEVLVIDDGSTDRTAEVAREAGADHVLSMGCNMGLARAFSAGIEEALSLGADVIVNTDADFQYRAEGVHDLVRPILAGEAKIVVGARPIRENADFSTTKKALQRLGSWVVRRCSNTDLPDAPSGFRAYSRDAAARICVINTYTYTLETIIQAGRKRIPMTSVPVEVNSVSRPSRLFRGATEYILRSVATILRVSVLYAPMKVFLGLAVLFGLPGLAGVGRFLVLFASGDGSGHVQSLVLSGALLAMATMMMAVGLLGDMIAANRTLLEDIRARDLLVVRKDTRRPEAVLELADAS